MDINPNDYMVFIYVFVALIPMAILLRCFHTLSKRIRKCRFFYALTSIVTIIFDIVTIYYVIKEGLTFESDNYIIVYGPIALAVLSVISYGLGKKKERLLEADILKENSYDVMDLRKTNQKPTINFSEHM